jgi:hypothetical protein
MSRRIYEQADKTGEKVTYSWIWDAPYNYKNTAESYGWKWIKGRPGCYVTNNRDAAIRTASDYGISIISNGTHAVHNVKMSHETN